MTDTTQTKPNSNGIKPKQTEPKQTKSEQIEPNPLEFEVPLSPDEEIEMFTEFMKGKRRMAVTAVSGQYKKGRLCVAVVPDTEQRVK